MYKVTISSGEKSISLTDNKNFILMPSSEGYGINANVNLSNLAIGDGSALNSIFIDSRHLSFNLQLLRNGNGQEVRKQLYDVIKPKRLLTINVITNNRNVFINGYCESLDFSTNKPITVSIAIVCPSPYWKTFGETVLLYGYTPQFKFIKNNTVFNRVLFGTLKTGLILMINYNGDTDTGAVFRFNIKRNCSYIGIENIDTGEKIIVDAEFLSGDKLVISTVNSDKGVTLTRNNEEYDYFSKVRSGSIFFPIRDGKNRFKVLLENGSPNLYDVFLDYNVLYGSV